MAEEGSCVVFELEVYTFKILATFQFDKSCFFFFIAHWVRVWLCALCTCSTQRRAAGWPATAARRCLAGSTMSWETTGPVLLGRRWSQCRPTTMRNPSWAAGSWTAISDYPFLLLLCLLENWAPAAFVRCLTRWLQRPYKHNMGFIEKINAHQSMWKAEPYPEHEAFTLWEMHNRAGGAASRIPKWVFMSHHDLQKRGAGKRRLDGNLSIQMSQKLRLGCFLLGFDCVEFHFQLPNDSLTLTDSEEPWCKVVLWIHYSHRMEMGCKKSWIQHFSSTALRTEMSTLLQLNLWSHKRKKKSISQH